MPPDSILAAALQSEYTSKYTTKADATKINFTLLKTAFIVNKGVKTKADAAKSVVAKCLNAIHGTISYPIAMTSYYLAGYGDHSSSHETFVHSHYPFTSDVREPECVDDCDKEDAFEVCLDVNKESEEVEEKEKEDRDNGDETGVEEQATEPMPIPRAAVMSQQRLYIYRHELLSKYSAVELGMMFRGGSMGKSFGLPCSLPTNGSRYGHMARRSLHLPRIIGAYPSLPSADKGTVEQKEEYASFDNNNPPPQTQDKKNTASTISATQSTKKM